MKDQQNPIIQILIGVSITVLSAFIVWKFGFEKNEPNPTPEIRVVIPEPKQSDKSIYQPPEPSYINTTIMDGLGIDQYGNGQIADFASIEVDGNIQTIRLSAIDGKIRGSAKFKLPKAGFYNFEIKLTTTFNNHQYGQNCTHNGYGSGKIYIEDGDVFEIMGDGTTINNPEYKVFLQKN